MEIRRKVPIVDMQKKAEEMIKELCGNFGFIVTEESLQTCLNTLSDNPEPFPVNNNLIAKQDKGWNRHYLRVYIKKDEDTEYCWVIIRWYSELASFIFTKAGNFGFVSSEDGYPKNP